MIAVTLFAALALAQSTPRQTLGIHGDWGAFRDTAPLRCFAIARAARRSSRDAFASVAFWPTAARGPQLHLRLGRARTPRARIILAIGERRFELRGGAQDAWSPDAETDRAIVAAMRGARSMSVETIAANGAPFADTYALSGAATAIDAAGVACARRG
jgi:hypothetical protein